MLLTAGPSPQAPVEQVKTFPLDVTNSEAMSAAVRDIEESSGAISLAILKCRDPYPNVC